MKINNKFSLYRVIRITIGCCLAITLAMIFNLQNSVSAGIITLLSIQNTKKETISLALQRFVAFVVAVIIAYACFGLIGYNIWSFGMYLFIFISFCYFFSLESVIAICSVLITHFWIGETMHLSLVLNGFSLLIIGAGIGVILNLFLSRKIAEITHVQAQIEQIMREIINKMAVILDSSLSAEIIEVDMYNLEKALDIALSKAYDTVNNTLTSDLSYYVQYVTLRRSQYIILHRIRENLPKITWVPEQAHTLARQFRLIAESFHEYNNALDLLKDYEQTKYIIRKDNLPKTREEFETRAILFQIFNDIEHFLLLKKDFSQALTEEQKEIFWSN
ncbi:hypothetical protein GC105_00055 [Alkalibaculum sp. M08DMB]|uniref:Putative aromatic acid exporter C-terminal domain-containing protein n=1 Tax=Alkalibaculum sporogenes TaxID=2655001 RepID=A0A6A7K495_9FIRM|nr:aromatic acid exporter family protein [Alkalibaculum sporogenes]MPW24191.1 hypothetical protein [Alkalibaculum sporogenes]